MLVATRRWYVGLCGILFLTTLIQHPSMPETLMGMQGMNLWNLTFAVVVVCWLVQRRNDPQRAPTTPITTFLFSSYVVMVVVVTIVAALDTRSFRGETADVFNSETVLIEGIVNPLKYVMVGVLFYDGAVTRTRVKWALITAIASGLSYSLLMFKSLKMHVFTMDFSAARRATDKLVGLFANDMAKLMAFALWGGLLVVLILDKRWQKTLWMLIVVCAVPAFVALKSRAGFLSFVMVGLTLGTLRWRRILVLAPIAVLIVVTIFPSVVDRVMMGVEGHGQYDFDEISSGRTTYLWPPAIKQIKRSPLIGHGRYTLVRTDCYDTILRLGRVVPTHPHNSYLEILLDAGVIGLIICLSCMFGLFRSSMALLWPKDAPWVKRDPLITALGAMALGALVSEMAAGVAGSSFYATQSTVPVLCVWGMAMRAAIEKKAFLNRQARHAQVQEPIEFQSTVEPQPVGV